MDSTTTMKPGTATSFAPGFRLSMIDLCVLLAGVAAAVVTGSLVPALGFAIAFVVGHFFLFCNVFRVGRTFELIWAAQFVLCTAGTLLFEIPGWIVTTLVSLATTILVIVLEIRKSSYHGLGWERINPRLRDCWEANTARTPLDSTAEGSHHLGRPQ